MFKILRCKLGARKGARFLQGASNSVRLDIFGWKTKNRHFVLTMNPHCRLSYYKAVWANNLSTISEPYHD